LDTTFHTDKGVFNYRAAAVWIIDGHILLHRQADDSYWALPGGRVMMGEDSKTSLIREMKEELGVEVQVERMLWLTENFFNYRGMPFHEIGLYYFVSCPALPSIWRKGPFHGLEGERLVYQWVSLNELSSMTVYPSFLQETLGNIPKTTEHIIVHS
jgi:8-oxo-dGTP pyrophosphatase MutT (NUDIX family)